MSQVETRPKTRSEWEAEIAARRRFDRQAIRDFVRAIQAEDRDLLRHSIRIIDERVYFGWRRAMRAIRKHPCQSEEFRKVLLNDLWLCSGEHIRNETNDDLVLIDALRAMLPRYTGPALTLYRGDGAANRRRRTYGLSWSVSIDTARSFARDTWQTTQGGSVLLEAHAPTDAIICAPALVNDGYGEEEYIVDRRRLGAVRVIERFPQRSNQDD